jgi:hypothetical protein
MSDVLDLRESIFAALGSILGTYTFGNGSVTPALAVLSENGELFPPENTQVEGLEVVIFRPTLVPSSLLQGYKIREEWILHLKQWEVGNGVQVALDSLFEADLEGFVISQVNEVPDDYTMGIPAGAQVKLSKFSISGA